MGRLFPVDDYYEQLEIDEEISELRGEKRRKILKTFDEYIFNSIANSDFPGVASLYILKTEYVDSIEEQKLLIEKAKVFASMSKKGTRMSSYKFELLKEEIKEIEDETERKIAAILGEDEEEEDILEEDFSEDYDESDEDDYEEEDDSIEEEKPKTILKRFL